MFESTVWVDTEGEARLSLEREIQITDRLYAFGEFQYDTDSKEEWLAGAGLILSKHFSIVGQYHSEYKGGIGINIRY
jgi:hypothetical protein